jgi:DNA replication protein DnaC
MTDGWHKPIEVVRALVEKWDSAGILSTPKLDKDGELFSSRMRRAVEADAAQRQLERRDPEEKLRREARGRALWDEDIRRYNQAQEEAIQADMPDALAGMGLEQQEIIALADLQDWPAVVRVREWIASDSLFLVMGGAVGTGKSLASALALQLACIERMPMADGRIGQRWTHRGTFLKAQELARLQTYGPEAEVAWERLRIRKLLIIDDLGTEAVTAHWLANIADLIDARMRRNVRTILTTNLTYPQFAAQYQARVMRRLQEHGHFFKAEKPKEGR